MADFCTLENKTSLEILEEEKSSIVNNIYEYYSDLLNRIKIAINYKSIINKIRNIIKYFFK